MPWSLLQTDTISSMSVIYIFPLGLKFILFYTVHPPTSLGFSLLGLL